MTIQSAPDYVDNFKKKALLRQHGVDDEDIKQLPLWPAAMRAIPNDAARSALFTVTRGKREAIENQLLYNTDSKVRISFTGIELRASDDELVWQQIINYVKNRRDVSATVNFTLYQLCKDLDWPVNASYYQRGKECLTRLKSATITLESERLGSLHALSLIREFRLVTRGKHRECEVKLSDEILYLFLGNYYTRVPWEKYRKLSPVARRLYDYLASHRHPHPLKAEKFQLLCGSKTKSSRKWLQICKGACNELMEADLIPEAWVYNGSIMCNR